jgi:hypothetical protein
MKKIIILLCFIAFAGIAKSQDNAGGSTLYHWNLSLSFSLPDLNPEAIQCSMVDFDPIEKFTNDFNLKSRESDDLRVAFIWDLLFKEVKGNEVFLMTTQGSFAIGEMADIPIGEKPVTKKWLISKTFILDGKPYCFAVPLDAENGANLSCKLDKSNMILLLDIYKGKIEAKK